MNSSFSVHAQIFSACGDFCSCRGVHEFAKRWTDGTSDVEQFSLQRLFQLDDMEHYSQSVLGTDFNLVCMMLQNLIHVTNIS